MRRWGWVVVVSLAGCAHAPAEVREDQQSAGVHSDPAMAPATVAPAPTVAQPIPPATLNQLTPDQRAMIEEQLRRASDACDQLAAAATNQASNPQMQQAVDTCRKQVELARQRVEQSGQSAK